MPYDFNDASLELPKCGGYHPFHAFVIPIFSTLISFSDLYGLAPFVKILEADPYIIVVAVVVRM